MVSELEIGGKGSSGPAMLFPLPVQMFARLKMAIIEITKFLAPKSLEHGSESETANSYFRNQVVTTLRERGDAFGASKGLYRKITIFPEGTPRS